MTPPSESSSGDIDLFRVQEQPQLPNDSFPTADYVVPRYPVLRYHSMQLALVIGLFACGGLICSMVFVDESDDFLGRRYWPRKSYSSPAVGTPQNPVNAPALRRNEPLRSNGERNAAWQEDRVGDCKPSATSSLSLASQPGIPN
jgi:hypothetical protein